MEPKESRQSQQVRCERCGELVPSYEVVNYGSMEQGYKQVCYQCLNEEMADAIGLEGFEHVNFEPVGLRDCAGELHEFHFRTNLFGPGAAIDAFELRNGNGVAGRSEHAEGDTNAIDIRGIERNNQIGLWSHF